MQPVVDGLEQEYGNRMTFQRLNAASGGRALFQRYNLPGHPAYVIVDKQGTVVWRFVGQTTRETLEQAIRRALE
jgi:thiol:disulfide interchange protein